MKGHASVEFALVVPFFFLLTFGAFEVGLILLHQLQLDRATTQAARFISLLPSKSKEEITLRAEQFFLKRGLRVQVRIDITSLPATRHVDLITIHVRCAFESRFPFLIDCFIN